VGGGAWSFLVGGAICNIVFKTLSARSFQAGMQDFKWEEYLNDCTFGKWIMFQF
jgi:hypothetical protein